METPELKCVSKDAKNLVEGLLCVDHKSELTVEQAIAHRG